MIQWLLSFTVYFPNTYGFPGFYIGICEENVNTAGLVANSFVSLREPGNMIDSWECGPLDDLMLMVDFILYTRSNRPWCTHLSELLCTNIQIDYVYLVSLLGSWVSVTIAGYAYMTSLPYEPWTLRFKCSLCSSLGRYMLYMFLYFVTREKACIRSLCLTCLNSTQCISFSCCFYSVPFAVINKY